MAQYKPRDPVLWKIMDRAPNLGCVALLAAFPLLLLAAVPLIPIFFGVHHFRRNYFFKTISRNQRRISWEDFLSKTQQSDGSVIIEVGNKRETRFWWTTDRVLSLAPFPPPEFRELNIIAYGGANQPAFSRWCYENYLAVDTGKATLIHPVKADFETFPFDEDYDKQMQNRFSRHEVAIITFYDVRY